VAVGSLGDLEVDGGWKGDAGYALELFFGWLEDRVRDWIWVGVCCSSGCLKYLVLPPTWVGVNLT